MSAGKNTHRMVGRARPVPALIPMAVSVRHVHLTQRRSTAVWARLCAADSQRCCRNRGNTRRRGNRRVGGPAGSLEHVRIVGPPRPKIRWSCRARTRSNSGSTPRCGSRAIWRAPRASSSKGTMRQGDAAAWRDLRPAAHPYDPADAEVLGLKNGDKVAAVVTTGDRRWSSATLS